MGPDHTLLAGTTSGTLVRWPPAQPSAPQIGRMSRTPWICLGSSRRGPRLGRCLRRHLRQVTSIVPTSRHGPAFGLAVTGATVFAGYEDGTVLRVSRRPTRVPVTLLHLRERVLTLAYSPKGNMIAVGGTSGTIGLYDATSGTLIRTLPHPHQANVYAIAFSPSGALVASSDVKDQVLEQSVNGTRTRSASILGVGFLAWQGNDTLLAGSETVTCTGSARHCPRLSRSRYPIQKARHPRRIARPGGQPSYPRVGESGGRPARHQHRSRGGPVPHAGRHPDRQDWLVRRSRLGRVLHPQRPLRRLWHRPGASASRHGRSRDPRCQGMRDGSATSGRLQRTQRC